MIGDDTLKGFGHRDRSRLSQSVDGIEGAAGTPPSGTQRRSTARRPTSSARRAAAVSQSAKVASKAAGGGSFQDWLASQVGGDDASAGTNGSQASEDYSDGGFYEQVRARCLLEGSCQACEKQGLTQDALQGHEQLRGPGQG